MSRSAATVARFTDALLICGPSGSGKTTFIDALVEGSLPAELAAALPPGAGRWPTFLEKDIRSRQVVLEFSGEGAQEGVVFHYDTFFVHRAGVSDYTRDPIYPYLREALHLTIVDLRPSAEALKGQFDRRMREKFRRMSVLDRYWKQGAVKHLKRLRYKLFRIGLPYTRDLYEDADKIDACYRSWDDFLTHVQSVRGGETRILNVVPEGEEGAPPRFRLAGARA